jgi:hemin uptake protein HemP
MADGTAPDTALGRDIVTTDRAALSGGEPPRPAARRSVSSADLFQGHRELVILHGGEEYRLRITRAGKLILTK